MPGPGMLGSFPVSDRNKLTAGDPAGPFGPGQPLSRIIEQHEERCGIKALADALEADETEKALDMVLFDLHVREFVKEKFALPEDELDFFLGRPLVVIIKVYGYSLESNENGTTLTKDQAGK